MDSEDQDPYENLSDDDPEYVPGGQECGENNSFRKKRKLTSYFQIRPRPMNRKEDSTPASMAQAPSAGSATISFHSEDLQAKFVNSPMLDGKFFKVMKFDGKDHVEAACQLCLPKGKVIQGSVETTTNFVKHLKRIHLTEYPAYTKYKMEKQKQRHSLEVASSSSSKLRQATLTMASDKKNAVNQAEFNKRVVHFIINTISAVSIIDHPSFKAMFEGFNVNVMGRKSAMTTIQKMFKSHQDDLKMQIGKQRFLCSTADIWSSKRRSFMGVTLHWLDDKLERVSVALACQRFRGVHNYKNIAEKLDYIYGKYGINTDQIIATVTDNASNFVKAFNEFTSQKSAVTESKEKVNPSLSVSDSDDSDASDNDIELTTIPDECDSAAETEFAIMLPKHVRCASHTLNLIATSDCTKAISSNVGVRTKHMHAIDKCRKLWTKAGRPGTAEIIMEVLGHTLSCPGETRWNSYFDCISRILHEDTKPKLATLHQKLGLPHFKETEIQYLEDYCQVMKPLATALDILQGETNTYFGYLLPTLTSLANKWEKMKNDFHGPRHFSANLILNTCSEALFRRFSSVFELESNEAVVAAVSLPKFKLRWFNTLKNLYQTNLSSDSIKQMVMLSAEQLLDSESEGCDSDTKDQDQDMDYDGYFDFNDAPGPGPSSVHIHKSKESQMLDKKKNKSKIELELLHYLDDKRTNLSILNDYANIKNLFVRYNTCLPSSAAVERLFSFATMVNNPRRHALTDDNFEKLVILKANKIGL